MSFDWRSLDASINLANVEYARKDIKQKYLDLHLRELCLKHRKKSFENFVEMLENRLERIAKHLDRNRTGKAYEAIQNLLFKLQKEANNQNFESCKEVKKRELYEQLKREIARNLIEQSTPLSELPDKIAEEESKLREFFGY
jgi:gamma-glutamylcysteine synthetase